jgi:hypothetical protein
MDDGSSVYSDGYADDNYVYGTGNTIGAYPIRSYAVDVTVTSPLGRTASEYMTSFDPGDVTTSTALSWNLDDFGVYEIDSSHRLYCWSAWQEFYMTDTETVTTPPAPPCTDKTRTCREYNYEGPVAQMKNHSCSYSAYCCGPDSGLLYGWCRREVCNKCPSQKQDPEWSRCWASRATCEGAQATWCAGGQCGQ